VGKSRIAVSLAKGRGEIISADSMQVYKYLDIGTAKPDKALLKQVKHHLIDVVDPEQNFSAYDFISRTKNIITEIHNKDLIPFIVGGTGLYIRSLMCGLSEAPGRNEQLRRRLDKIEKQKGLLFLYKKLQQKDHEYASVIKENDRVRIKRALEVYYSEGRPFSGYLKQHDKSPLYNALWIGLTEERKDLYAKINARTESMYDEGLVKETRDLLRSGYSEELLERKGIGYKEAIAYINKKLTLEQAKEETMKKTRNYAKRQMTWFRKEKHIKWFHPDEIEQVRSYLDHWLLLNNN